MTHRGVPEPPQENTRVWEHLPLCKQLSLSFYFLASFSFGRKEIFPWEHMILGELPWHNALGFLCKKGGGGKPPKIYKKK